MPPDPTDVQPAHRVAQLLDIGRMFKEFDSVKPPAGSQSTAGGALAVGIATVGRAETLRRTLDFIRLQTRRPDRIVICAPQDADVMGLEAYPDLTLIVGPRGLPIQRNAVLDAVQECDRIVFFDDDFVPHADYLAQTEHVFQSAPDVVMTTGLVLKDGILGPGLPFDDAETLIGREPILQPADVSRMSEVYNSYGCNMGINLVVARQHAVRFDQTLPLYAWWEDVDFSRRMARFGRIVRVRQAKGVHLGTKSGRQSGVRLGYSQIANPVYLLRKGTCTPLRASAQITRNVLANLAKSLWPEHYVDRRGRVRGNVRAIADLVSGRLSPMRVLDF